MVVSFSTPTTRSAWRLLRCLVKLLPTIYALSSKSVRRQFVFFRLQSKLGKYMTDPWKEQPADLGDRIKDLLRRASKLNLEPELIDQYARIFIAAQEVVEQRDRDEQKTSDIVACVAAAEHGIYTDDPVQARTAYASARAGQQQVYASASGCAGKLTKLERLLEMHYRQIRVDVAERFPLKDLVGAVHLVRDFAAAAAPGKNLATFKMQKSELSRTIAGHTFSWWFYYVPRYKGKWADMHSLARCWHLTDVESREAFKRSIRKVRPAPNPQGGTIILSCPPWALS